MGLQKEKTVDVIDRLRFLLFSDRKNKTKNKSKLSTANSLHPNGGKGRRNGTLLDMRVTASELVSG